MRRLLTAVVAAGLLAGCSSSSAVSASQASTTTRARPVVPVAAPAPSPRRVATRLAHRLLGEAVLPPDARRTASSLPKLLRGPWLIPGGGSLVDASQAYTVPDSPEDVIGFLKRHLSRGLVASGTGSSSSPTERVDYVADTATPLPANIAAAGIEIGVEAHGTGSLVNVVAGAEWTPPRATNELVGNSDDVVVVSSYHPYAPGMPVVRRTVVGGKDAFEVARAFNALLVAPRNETFNCPLLNDRSVGYHLAFGASASAPPDIVATLPPCGTVAVAVGGRKAAALTESPALAQAVARALGVPVSHLFR